MFKRIISALVCLLFTVCGFAAKLTATLQSGDKITPFYGDNAFVDAYNAAVNGDVITLSPGAFKATNIEKSITVIGAYAFSEDLSKTTQFSSPVSISGDNVTLEGVRFVYTLMIEGTDNLIVNRCWIDYLNATQKEGHKYHNNTILTDCYIDDNFAMPLSQNMVLRNCSVNHFNEMNEIGNPALIENCNVTLFAYHNIGVSYHQPYAIYRNCLLGLYKTVRYDYPPLYIFTLRVSYIIIVFMRPMNILQLPAMLNLGVFNTVQHIATISMSEFIHQLRTVLLMAVLLLTPKTAFHTDLLITRSIRQFRL